MNLEDLAKQTINEVNTQIEEQKRQSELLKEQELAQKERDDYDEISITSKDEEEILVLEEPQIQDEAEKQNSDEIQVHEEKSLETQTQISTQESEVTKPQQDSTELQAEILSPNVITQVQNLSEDIFLKNLRERILVLFEGLNSVDKNALEQRLNLTTNFLEFLLANIEDKLKK